MTRNSAGIGRGEELAALDLAWLTLQRAAVQIQWLDPASYNHSTRAMLVGIREAEDAIGHARAALRALQPQQPN